MSIERTVVLGDGAATTLEQWGERGPVLLGVHGITSSRKSWERMALHFAPTHRVFAYDQRGHGDSAHVRGPMTLERSLLDLETVARTIGEPILGLVGHSWGGAVALRGGKRIDTERVIAIDPMIYQAPGTWYADFVDDLRAVFDLPIVEREAKIRDFYKSLAPIDIDAKIHAMRRMSIDPIVELGAINRVDAGDWDLRPDILDYPKPLLLLLADQSDSVVAAPDAAFVRARGGSNLTIEVFEGEGHSLQRTAFERFIRSAEAFLRR